MGHKQVLELILRKAVCAAQAAVQCQPGHHGEVSGQRPSSLPQHRPEQAALQVSAEVPGRGHIMSGPGNDLPIEAAFKGPLVPIGQF